MILIIDNYDSFTWNLVQLFGALGADLLVRRNDQITIDEVADLNPSAIVLSPGPCTPDQAGISVDLIRSSPRCTPMLGVCLGHQAIGAAFGARIVRAARPMHGKVSTIRHSGTELFRDLPAELPVARYHSLVIDPRSVPPVLEVVGWSDGAEGEPEIQAVRHRDRPVWGVQFHPESVATEQGERLLHNFLSLV